jgi:hypothetical protein
MVGRSAGEAAEQPGGVPAAGDLWHRLDGERRGQHHDRRPGGRECGHGQPCPPPCRGRSDASPGPSELGGATTPQPIGQVGAQRGQAVDRGSEVAASAEGDKHSKDDGVSPAPTDRYGKREQKSEAAEK